MRVDLFDFDLPESHIALRPAAPRDSARLLVVSPALSNPFQDRHFSELSEFLRAGDLLVCNDTRVIPAKLSAHRAGRNQGSSQAKIELTLHQRIDSKKWLAFARPAKRLVCGDQLIFDDNGRLPIPLVAELLEKKERGEILLAFNQEGSTLDRAIESIGQIPLPPYISKKRPLDHADYGDYQTIFARHSGAVAAPTAGLHFTENLCKQLEEKGISRVFVTLHVGAGTFLPLNCEDTDDHHMHPERGVISAICAEKIRETRDAGGRIIAVGTTVLRLLESATGKTNQIQKFDGITDIFITPGYDFRVVDLLVTNFHLPRSTLFMLVCAFSGLDMMKKAYRHAIREDYQFYSYGDACLLHRNQMIGR